MSLKISPCQALTRCSRVLKPKTLPQKGALLTILAATTLSPFSAAFLGSCYISYKWATTKISSSSYTESNSRIGRWQGGALNLSQALPVPKQLNLESLAMQAGLKGSGCPTPPGPILESRAVYHPFIPKPSASQTEELCKELDSVKEAADKVIGFSCVLRKDTNDWTPVVFTQQTIGRAKTFKAFAKCSTSEKLKRVGIAGARIDHDEETQTYLRSIENCYQDNLKYVGYLLIKVVQEVFKKDCQGRMILESVEGSIGFYEKLGFVLSHPMQALPEDETPTFPMHIPLDSRGEWLETINCDPITLESEE